MKKTFFILVFLFSLVGCSSSSETLTVLPSSTQTNTSIPTTIQKPATPTVTPFPELQTDGPYFSYFRAVDEEYQLVMLDADGKGRKEISFPQEIKDAIANQEFFPSMQFVSPTGEWMAYFTGSAGKFPLDPANNQGSFDLKLNLLNLKTLETETSISLLSEDYPNNFIEAEKQINDPNINAITLQGTFVIGITNAIAWSPDGKYLAFAGQMDGLSSDLYIYEVETQTIRRLSSGLQQLQWISWSPNGQKILYASTYIYGIGTVYDVYISNFDGTSAFKLSSSLDGHVDWLNEVMYFENDSENGLGKYKLRLVNNISGNVSSIWKGAYQTYVLDKNSEFIALTAFLPDINPDDLFNGVVPETSAGLYIINLSNLQKTEIKLDKEGDHLRYKIYPLGLDNRKFILIAKDLQSYFISEDLELIPIDVKDLNVSVAPDNSFWVGLNNKSLNIYSTDNNLIKSISLFIKNPAESEIIWNPDSSGLFIQDDINFYFIDISNEVYYLVESNMVKNYFHNYLWLTINESRNP